MSETTENIIPFNFEEAYEDFKKGIIAYQCRDPEWEAEMLAWDMDKGTWPLAVRYRKCGDHIWRVITNYTKTGLCYPADERPFDLVMKPTTRTMYVRMIKTFMNGYACKTRENIDDPDFIVEKVAGGKWVSDIVAIEVKE